MLDPQSDTNMLDIEPPPFQATINIQRNAHNMASMSKEYNIKWEDEMTAKEKIKLHCVSYFHCSRACVTERILRFLPFIEIMRNYKWKSWLVLDLIAGLSMGVMHIPQGMGFALLTSVPPVYGLYSSFFPPVIYFLFGTSKHLSMGTMALISLMIGAVVDREAMNMGYPSSLNEFNGTQNETEQLKAEIVEVKIGLAVSVTFLMGCIQLLMGILNLGIVATFMSMPFVGSFLTGAAVHIIVSQFIGMLGLKLTRIDGIFKVPLTVYEIFSHITDTNVAALIIGLICMIFLVTVKEIINEKFRSKLKVPIPAELIVVVLGTIGSYFGKFNDKYKVAIVGTVPSGIPAPRMPPLTNAQNYIGDSIVIAIISVVISFSMAKMMARKHKYHIDMNQELNAYGLTFGISAIFNSFGGAQAPPRTLVHDSVNGKTQVAGLFSSVLLLLVLLVIGPLFQDLPISVLSVIVICALLPLFRQFKELPTLWRINIYDFLVWIITFIAVVILDVITGLIIGIGICIFFVVLQFHCASGSKLVSVAETDIFIPDDGLLHAHTGKVTVLKIFQFYGPLIFANVEKFKMELFEKTVHCQQVLMVNKLNHAIKEGNSNGNNSVNHEENNHGAASIEMIIDVAVESNGLQAENSTEAVNHNGSTKVNESDQIADEKIQTIILDCSGITYTDIMGVYMLKSLHTDYKSIDVDLVLANCCNNLLKRLTAGGAVKHVFGSSTDTSYFKVYPTLQDAVAVASTHIESIDTVTIM